MEILNYGTIKMDIAKIIEDNEIQFLSLKYFDDSGYRQVEIPVNGYKNNQTFKNFEVDGSTLFVDPFRAIPTLNVVCSLKKPDCIRTSYKNFMSKYNDILVGFNIEFFIFDEIKATLKDNYVNAELVNTETNSLHNEFISSLDSTMQLESSDVYSNIRAEIVQNLINAGIQVENCSKSEYQCQSQIKVSSIPIANAADIFFTTKYIIKQTALSYGKIATFITRPLDLGVSKLTLDLSLKNYTKEFGKFRENFLQHSKVLLPFSNPTVDGPIVSRHVISREIDPVVFDAHNKTAKFAFFENLTNMYYSLPILICVMFDENYAEKPKTENNNDDPEEFFDLDLMFKTEDTVFESMNSSIPRRFVSESVLQEYYYGILNQIGRYRDLPNPITLKLYYNSI